MPAPPGRGAGWEPWGGEQYPPRPTTLGPFVGPLVTASGAPPARPFSASRRSRPNSAAPKSTGSVRPGSAPGKAQANADAAGWWLTPDQSLLHTPRAMIELRRPAAEELQHELTMTATVLRTAQSRLAEEREMRLRARAAEELAMVDVRRAKEESRAIREEQRDSDRQLTKALMQQRRELEDQIRKQESEQEHKIAAMHAEREKQADAMRESHEAHARQLEDQLKEMLEERNQLLAEQYDEHKREAEKLVKAAADKASQLEQAAERKLDEEREKRVQHLQQIGVRRLFQQGLARGWTAWRDVHQERTRRRRLLQVRQPIANPHACSLRIVTDACACS